MNGYLIPANAKKSKLILGYFTPVDLILFGSGCAITVLLLMVWQGASFAQMIIIILPALVTGFLVMPVQHYHNVLQFITNVITFYSGRRRYYWKGWCTSDESSENE